MVSPRTDKFGPVQVPPVTVSTDGHTLVESLDPTIDALLLAFKTVLQTKLDATWAKAAKGISSHVVVGTYAYEPIRPVATVTWQWPALFMWRVKERYFKRTQFWNDAETTGKLAFILPPLPLDVFVKLQPIRVAVRNVLYGLVEHFGDPSYSSGANILLASELESFTFTEASYGFLPADTELELYHPVLDMTWVMRERETTVSSNYETLSSISTDIWIGADSNATEVLFIEDTFDALTE